MTDNQTTSEESVYIDFSNDMGDDMTLEDALYLRICPEEQDPCSQTWNANPATRVSKLLGCEFQKGTVLDVAGIMHRNNTFL